MSDDLPSDIRQKQQLTNDIGTELQQKFGEAKLQIILDLENPYDNAIGFLIPLTSVAHHIMELAFPEALQGQSEEEPEQPEQTPEEEPTPEPLPSEEQPPSDEDQDVREVMMWRAGIK